MKYDENDFLSLVKKAKPIIEKEFNIKIGTLSSDEKKSINIIFPSTSKVGIKRKLTIKKFKYISNLYIIYYIYENEIYEPCVFLFRDENNILRFRFINKYIKKVKNEDYDISDNFFEKNSLFFNEGYLNKVTMGLKIKPHQNLEETLKKHSYQGYLNFIKKCKNIDDLKYLRKDCYIGINTINKIKERIYKINKYGNNKETHTYYNNINKKYISKGITVKDCELTIKWFKEICIKEINKKIKEIK